MSELSLSRRLVRLLVARAARGLPRHIVDKTQLHITDAVGIGLAAAGSALAEQVCAAAASGSCGGRCGVLGLARREAPAPAAFIDAALFHILDFDDIHDQARLHPTTVTLAAALAAASLADASGRRVVEAVALGNELICRLGVALSPTGQGPGSDWFLTQLFGTLGAALSSGLVLGHGEDMLVASLGLACMQTAGSKQAGFGTGSTARAVYPAFAAQAGVQASVLAAAGLTGPEQSLDGAAGLFRIYLGIEPHAAMREVLLDPDVWHAEQVRIKPWPSCRLSHPYVAASLALRRELDAARVATVAVARIDVAVNASAARLCQPLVERRRPATLQDAKYSIPWMVAFTLARGRVDLVSLDDEARAAPDIHALVDLIAVDERLPDKPGHPPAEIRLTLDDGRVFDSPRDLSFAMSDDDVRAKFADCTAFAGKAAQADSLWARLSALGDEPGLEFLYA